MARKRNPFSVTQIILGLVVLLAIVGIGGVLGGSSWINSFLRGVEFRKLVSDNAGKALNADVVLEPLKWNGSNVYSPRISAKGREGSRIGSIDASQVRAAVDWRAAWDGSWKVSSLEILELQAVFRRSRAHPEETAKEAITEIRKGWLPQKFELGFLRAERGNVKFEAEDGTPQVELNGTVLTIQPKGRTLEIAVKGGTLDVPKVPQMNVESANARLSDGTFFLTESRMTLGDSGKVRASGEFGSDSKIQIVCEDVNPVPFLDEQWKTRLSGKLAGETELLMGDGGIKKSTGNFSLTDGRLENIELLDQIAKFTSSPQFRRMPLQEVSGDFIKENGLLTVTKFMAESKGLLKTEGEFTLADAGEVRGTFLLGVSPQVLQWVPGSRERVFKENRDGYVWTTVNVGGTLTHPTEDLTSRLKEAMAGEVVEQGTKVIEQLPEGVSKELKDGAKGVLDALTPLFGR